MFKFMVKYERILTLLCIVYPLYLEVLQGKIGLEMVVLNQLVRQSK
ncbi:MAG: hypothetical protein JWR72_194 [Flavisolibacter sp.]|jgi:hypothetical protein|nr:hypothetical protein [Flavisolibacter sp.]